MTSEPAVTLMEEGVTNDPVVTASAPDMTEGIEATHTITTTNGKRLQMEPEAVVAPNAPPSPSAPASHPFGGLVHRFKRQPSTEIKDTKQATATPPVQSRPLTKAPKDTLKAVYAAGQYKAGLTLDVLAVQSFMAGVYIASAAHLYLAVGGGVIGSAVFPGGLIAVLLTSAELFTGDALIFVASVLGGKVTIWNLLRNWSVAWMCNFVGSIAWAFFIGYLSGAIEDSGAAELSIKIAEKKALSHMSSIFLKAIGANFMVCVAVWQGTCAEEVAGKVLSMWFPTSAFIMMGFEHCVANMFMIPMGMMLGANVGVGRMFAAILMATLGNIVGGGMFVGAVYWYVFDSMSSFNGLRSSIRHNMTTGMARGWHHASSFGGISHSSHHNRGHHGRHPSTASQADSEQDDRNSQHDMKYSDGDRHHQV